MSINERLKILIDTLEGGTVLRFSKKIGVAHTSLASMMPGSRESKPGFEIIAKIAEAYPQVSLEWLLTGVGEMLKNGRPNEEKTPYMSASPRQTNTNYNTANGNVVNGPAPGNPELEYLRERVRELEKQNTDLLTRLLGLIK